MTWNRFIKNDLEMFTRGGRYALVDFGTDMASLLVNTAIEDVGLDVPTGLEDLVAASPTLL